MFRRPTTSTVSTPVVASPARPTPPPMAAARQGSSRRDRCVWALLCFWVFGILLMAMLTNVPLAAQGNETWATTPLTTPRNSHTVTRLSDGRLLVAGGWDGAHTLASAELYAPGTQSWTPTAALSVPRSYHSAVLLPDGRALVVGGWDRAGQPLANAELYDPAAASWQPAGAPTAARSGHTALLLPNGKVLVVGGCTADGAVLASAELYDPAKDAWTPAAPLRDARCWHTATLLPDGRVLVVGGRDSHNQSLTSTELYDPQANAWAPAAVLPTPRRDHTATLLRDGRVLVVGGYDGRYLADAQLYDAARNVWSPAGALSLARAYHSATLLPDGAVLVAGGANGSRPSASAERYEPQTHAWTPAEALPAPYASHVATLLSDGKILITGRPGSDDPTGNDGQPRPTATSDQDGRRSWAPGQPTPTPAGRGARGKAPGVAAERPALRNLVGTPVPAPLGNVTAGAGTARLYGLHEVSFTLSNTLYSNPYTLSTTFVVTFTRPDGENEPLLAFYDGPGGAGRDLWKARVYVNRVGYWSWTPPASARDYVCYPDASCSFPAIEQPAAGLHGMLRVVSETQTIASPPTPTNPTLIQSQAIHVGTPKRWYTDDGHTFLPMADTAYRLFFKSPGTPGTGNIPSECPLPESAPPPTPTREPDFVHLYASDVVSHGVNVLRVESLGTWAYTDQELAGAGGTRGVDCVTDLSLFWSGQKVGSSDDLFDGGPSITNTQSITLYPNLQSFQRTDLELQDLLNELPGLYIQILLMPEPVSVKWDHDWLSRQANSSTGQPYSPGIPATYRMQLWRTMLARWAAFPNVFWSISNDLDDTKTNNKTLADEVGNYFQGDPWARREACQDGVCREEGRRPMSLGHLRERRDASIAKPWHTYITAYSAADISAQQMDGEHAIATGDMNGPDTWQQAQAFGYSREITPTFNVEDRYENEVTHPSDFYRRLFWAYLLSGGGATYGGAETWKGVQRYSTNLSEGLDTVRYITDALAAARVDLGRFKPNDSLVPNQFVDQWSEFDRAQVTSRGKQEILAYIPNTDDSSTTTPDHSLRTNSVPATTRASIEVNMAAFTDTTYAVTWYDPTTGLASPITSSIPGTTTAALTAPEGLTGDAVLHISSRCENPNACLPMDVGPENYSDWRNGFKVTPYTATLNSDTAQRVFGGQEGLQTRASWRCDRPIGASADYRLKCLLYFLFPSDKPIASVDYYFRRNSHSGHQSIEFITAPAPTGTIPFNDAGWPESGINVGFNPEGDVYSNLVEWGSTETLNVRHGVPLASNRWYHLEVKAKRRGKAGERYLDLEVLIDGRSVLTSTERFQSGDEYLRGVVLDSAWWGPIDDLDSSIPITPSIWWDELSIDPPPDAELRGLYRTNFQQGLGHYAGNSAAWFDAGGGYNDTTYLHMGANGVIKSLLRFDVSALPANAVVDDATLQIYYASRSNGNTLTVGAHRVLPEWVDSQANWSQRKTGVNWSVGGMGSGSDYTATAEATAALTGAGGAWVELDVTNAAQAWVNNPATNYGLVLLQEAASGYVTYDFCSELGWSPCTAAQTPRLILRYHLLPPAPVKATFQQGSGGYSGNQATYFDAAYGYNNSYLLQVGAANSPKTLLKFDVSSIPAGKKVDEATLRLYYLGRINTNSLTLGAHRVLAAWTDSQANWTQRQTGVNWQVAGMGSGSDYAADADGAADVLGNGGSWVELDVSDMAQAWIKNAADNKGLVALAEAASGSVVYDFCSELGWSPCTSAQAPKLTIWYH